MKEVELLGVVIRPERIKIEEEKVKGILDWPTLNRKKIIESEINIKKFK